MQTLFGKIPSFRKRNDQNTLYTRIISKKVLNFLELKGMQIGKKSNLKIPEWIKAKGDYSKSFIRGLFDTDGSLILRKRKQNSISWGQKDKNLVFDLKSMLEKQGYFVCYNKEERHDKRGFVSIIHSIRINRKEHIKKFISEIGSSNPYKINRCKKMAEKVGMLGFEPRS